VSRDSLMPWVEVGMEERGSPENGIEERLWVCVSAIARFTCYAALLQVPQPRAGMEERGEWLEPRDSCSYTRSWECGQR
jgi:hypothetical protein